MAKRETAATASKRSGPMPKGGKQTPAQKKAGEANLAKGRAKMNEQRAKAKAEGRERAGVRWAKVLDGTLTVKDLDDEEVRRGQVRGADGGFTGTRPAVPSHLVEQFHKEHLARVMSKFKDGVGDAVQLLVDAVTDPDVKMETRVKAADMLINRVFGKAPETIRIQGADRFEGVVAEAVGLERNIPDDASGLVGDKDR